MDEQRGHEANDCHPCYFAGMGIQIHPDAAKRFDELASELLAKLTSEPSLAPAEGAFRPDLYPVFQITEQDIIGEIRQTRSSVDGTGDEVGRSFERDGRTIGLAGDGFKALTHLATRMLDVEGLSSTTTLEFIRNAAFEWIESKYKNAAADSCSQYVLKKAEDAIKDFEIWIPLHGTYLESSFSIGRVTFRTITADMLAKSYAKMEETVQQESEEIKAGIRIAVARERSQLQSCAAAVMKIRAEESKAIAVAREQTECAIALLRFLSPANWTPKLRSFCTPLGSENVRRSAELIVDGDSILSSRRGVLDRKQLAWALPSDFIAQFPGVLQRLSSLADTTPSTPFRQSLYDALLIYSRNSVAADPADKLVYILVALESMLLRNESEPIGKNIGERMAFLTGNALETRKAVVANVTETYRLRSSFIHHGHSIGDLETLSTFMLNAWTCFYNLLMRADRYQTKDELIGVLEDLKMS